MSGVIAVLGFGEAGSLIDRDLGLLSPNSTGPGLARTGQPSES